MFRIAHRSAAVLPALFCFVLFFPPLWSQDAQDPKPTDRSSSLSRLLFESHCSACHGLDGRGAERAPDIATNPGTRRRSDVELVRILQKGMPQNGMPAFGSLGSEKIKALVTYVRLLQGKSPATSVAGNLREGEGLFFGKARCSECHLVNGKGGFIAGDLSVFGKMRSAEQVRTAIVEPGNPARRGAVVDVTTRTGEKYSGVVRNEDNFSIQLQALDGTFHLFEKSDLNGVRRQPAALMPTDYGSSLSPAELTDLVRFLISVSNDSAGQNKKAVASKKSRPTELGSRDTHPR